MIQQQEVSAAPLAKSNSTKSIPKNKASLECVSSHKSIQENYGSKKQLNTTTNTQATRQQIEAAKKRNKAQ